MPIVLATASGTSVGDLADRTLRDWLHSPEDQPVIITFAADVTATATTWTYSEDTLAPDEEDLLAPGTLVQAGTELARITAVDYDANSLTVTRGVSGTAKSTHSSGDEITVAPVFPRKAVVDAVSEEVVALYPQLWHVATTELTTDSDYVEVPAEAITPVQFLWKNGSRYQNTGTADLMDPFPPSSTGKALQFYGVPTGKTGYFTYRAKFARPDNEADDVGELGVDQAWERIICVGAAAQVVGSRPVDQVTVEYIVEQLEREAVPPGATTDIRNGLLTLRNIWLEQANRALRSEQSVPVVHNIVRRG